MAKSYRIRVYKQIHVEDKEFATRDDARTYASKLRKDFATGLGMHWVDLFFECNETPFQDGEGDDE